MLIGLLYHVLVWIAVYGQKGGTPGWYLFVLAGPIGLIAGLGVSRLCEVRLWRSILVLLSTTGIMFTAGVSYLQVLMYSGCATRNGPDSTLSIPPGSGCWIESAVLIAKLDVVAFPVLGIAAAAIGLGVGVTGAIYGGRRTDTDDKKFVPTYSGPIG